ncbi:MAG: rRNA maturation RNase YbeY [Holosporales bacterium]|jgi:probable rRNA maturation factor|nr:rRNA maturation RNase YbeY [Holosporales bacterium]
MKNKATIWLSVHDEIWLERHNGGRSPSDWQIFFERPLLAVLERLKRKGSYMVSVWLSNNDSIRALNKKHRNIDRETDVLSFPQYSREELKNLKDVLLGDVVLSYNVINDAVSSISGSFLDAVAHLFVHGVLHNFGYDHGTEADEEEMLSLESDILRNLEIVLPHYEVR